MKQKYLASRPYTDTPHSAWDDQTFSLLSFLAPEKFRCHIYGGPTVPCTSRSQMYLLVVISIIYSKMDYKPCRIVKKWKLTIHQVFMTQDQAHQSASLIRTQPRLSFPLSGGVFAQFFPFLQSQAYASFSWLEINGLETALFHPQFQTLTYSNLFMCLKAPTYLWYCTSFVMYICVQSLSPFSHARPHISGGFWQYLHYLVSSWSSINT